MGQVDPGSAWKLRFWLIFLGQSSSMIGSAMTQFVLIWWITDSTGSISALAMAGLFALLPQALLGPLGGTLADRYSRRLIMITADLISALCMGVLIVLFLTDSVELWHLYTMMAVRSSMQAFQGPASAASVAMLVPQSFLARAAGLSQTMMGIMTVAAAPLGALAISLMPIGWALSIDVFTALLGIVPLLVFRIPQLFAEAGTRANLWGEFREGVSVVWTHPGLLRLYALVTVTVLVIMPGFTLVPLLVRDHFGGGAPQVALIEAIGGIAMIAGGVLVAAISPKRLVLWVILGFAASSFTLGFVALMPGDQFTLAVAWWAISSVAFVMGNAPLTTLLQTTIPNELQGRVLSLLSTVIGLSAPVGLAIATPLGELVGVRWLFAGMGILSGIVCMLGLLSPVLLRMEKKAL